MGVVKGLVKPNVEPANLYPSPRQGEMVKLLLFNHCPKCMGDITGLVPGEAPPGRPDLKPRCPHCGNDWFPQIILGGGAAGGGKSYIGSWWIVSTCCTYPGVRAALCRKTIKSLKESTFNTVKQVMREMKLEEGVNFKINNLEGIVTFWNGSQIYLKELDNQPSDENFERLGSSEFGFAMIDECSEVSEKAVEVLFSRCRHRSDLLGYPRILMTTNPCANWVRDRFVMDADGNPVQLKDYEAFIRFSLLDNPCESFKKVYKNALEKLTSKVLRDRLLYGNWDFSDENSAAAYYKFDGERHLVEKLKEKVYVPTKPIILSFDFNVLPYMSCLAFQLDEENKKLYCIEEILGKPEDKENNTPKLAQKLRKKYLDEGHLGGIIITGDPAGLARSTQTEEGVNNFSILTSILSSPILRPSLKLLPKSPSQLTRLDFINSVFNSLDGWEILIDLRCRQLTNDLVGQRRNADGTKNKSKVSDPRYGGAKYEKYGHMSDAFDMCCCMFIKEPWKKFNSKAGSGITTFSGTPIYGTFEY